MGYKIRKIEISDVATFVAISVVVLWLSYMTAAKLYDKSHLIPYGVLLVSCFLLLEAFVALCYSFLDKLSSLAVKNPIEEVETALSSDTSQEGQERESEIYRQSETDSITEAKEFRLKRQNAIHDYIFWAMAPILEEEEMAALWLEYKEWLDRPLYKPKGRNWKWKQGMDVKHIDIRHMTWNIAKRMGMEKGYSTVVCGKFIKALFPDICKNIDWFALSKCLNADPNKGNVKIDVPEESNPIVFHYPKPDKKEGK